MKCCANRSASYCHLSAHSTHHLKPTIGYSSKVDEQLYQAANIKDCELWRKHVILLLDEMHRKEDLVFDKHTGELVGFVNLGQLL